MATIEDGFRISDFGFRLKPTPAHDSSRNPKSEIRNRCWLGFNQHPSEIRNPARGSALLAVLWLSLALSAIAFSLASTVQGETERTSTAVDGLRSYYLATGAIERAILYMQWGKRTAPTPDSPFYYP